MVVEERVRAFSPFVVALQVVYPFRVHFPFLCVREKAIERERETKSESESERERQREMQRGREIQRHCRHRDRNRDKRDVHEPCWRHGGGEGGCGVGVLLQPCRGDLLAWLLCSVSLSSQQLNMRSYGVFYDGISAVVMRQYRQHAT